MELGGYSLIVELDILVCHYFGVYVDKDWKCRVCTKSDTRSICQRDFYTYIPVADCENGENERTRTAVSGTSGQSGKKFISSPSVIYS